MKKCEYNPYREIVQFNNLIVDSSDFLSVSEFSASTKTSDHDISFGNGSYVDMKREQQFVEAQEFDATIHIAYKEYPILQRKFLKDFIKKELIKFGKIWAIEDDKLLWAYCYMTDFSEAYESFKGFWSVDISCLLPEGIWHIADPKRTFLRDYDSCDILECEDFRDVYEDCLDCCVSCNSRKMDDCENCLCDCEEYTKEDSLCMKSINDFKNCGKSMRITYDCLQAERIFGKESWGKKICKPDICKSTIAGRFYSPTILDTKGTITLTGIYKNPTVTINDVKTTIKGDYDGVIKITDKGEYYYQSDPCCEFDLIDLENIQLDSGSLTFPIHHGYNRLIVENSCCTSACAYVRADNITY